MNHSNLTVPSGSDYTSATTTGYLSVLTPADTSLYITSYGSIENGDKSVLL
jgi:hypothetical protein